MGPAIPAISFRHIGGFALIVGILGGLILYLDPFSQQDEVWVADDSIPACHLLSTTDLKMTTMESDSIPSNAVRNITSNLSRGRFYCIIDPLEKDDFILDDNLIEIPNQSRLTIIGVPASHASALGGSMKPNDTINLVVPRVIYNISPEPEPWSIINVTLLGVLDNPRDNASDEYTLIVMLPEEKALRLINETASMRAFAIKEIS